MPKYEFGFIGTGNMGSALANAVAKTVKGEKIALADNCEEKAKELAKKINATVLTTRELILKSKFIFLGLKPQIMREALEPFKEILSKRTDKFILVTMAAGMKISTFYDILGGEYPIIRIMPNTPVGVGKGMILYTHNAMVDSADIEEFCTALKFAGRLDLIDEGLIDAGSAVSGCGPAFVYLFANALTEAGVEAGLTKEKALLYASQTLSGAAELLLNSNKSPKELTDNVCSPGGSTIEGVKKLEELKFNSVVKSAVKASFEKTKLLGK